MIYRHLMVAYDGSEHALRGLEQARALAGGKAAIDIVYVDPAESEVLEEPLVFYTNDLEERLDRDIREQEAALRKLAEDIPNARGVVLGGHAAKSLLKYAEETDVDLIVIGSRGLDGLRELLLGSVSHNVAQHAKVPVLIVK
ncbi:universal stress protein [Saccharibacillus kuerlensis]|uniref:Universal stress protein n=1 Tax=Saccharibacillus kuerlensis TaxID=459527 RepID=A0ABQ2KZN6_9BACL|nr:universal stress protein [Saccharibacillus kuerlensis]GGN97876.1 universal stress protein [Saccharibacillus kuerlensis]